MEPWGALGAALRAVALLLLVAGSALTPGAATLRLVGLRRADFSSVEERWLLAAAVGLGMEGLALTLAGLLHVLWPSVALALPVALALACARFGWPLLFPDAGRVARMARAARMGREAWENWDDDEAPVSDQPRPVVPAGWRFIALWTPLCWVALAGLAALCLVVAVGDLAPPTDYDGLLYHLEAPRIFLQQHAIVYIPHNFSANLPMLGEMLYLPPLAGGSDRTPQLIHALAAGLAVALTSVMGARVVGPIPAFWGAVGLAATPLVPFLTTRSYIDLFTVLFAVPAVGGVLFWLRWPVARQVAWLRLAGIAAGLALATKYAAFSLALALGMVVVLAAWWRAPEGATRWERFQQSVLHGFLLAWPATLVALPWYLRQTLTLGNPVWPMYFGGRDWGAARVAQLTYFVSQYGAGTSWRDTLLLPWNVFWQSWRFGHVPQSFPPLLTIAVPLALLVRRSGVRWLLGISLIVTVLWVKGWQDLRFLLTVYPLFALLGAAGLLRVVRRQAWLATACGVAMIALLGTTLWGEAARTWDRLPVVVGREPVAAYLQRTLDDQRAIGFLNDAVPTGRSVLFLGDGQVWYCRARCIPDPAHDNLLNWFLNAQPAGHIDVESVAKKLQAERVSHVLLSKKDYWYLEHQDPESRLKRQLAEFYVFKAKYLSLVYEDSLTEVYQAKW